MNDGCQTQIMVGCRKGLINKVVNGIKNGEDINVSCEYYGMTGLVYASKYGHSDIVQLLLNNGCSRDTVALQWAIVKEHVDIISILYKAGVEYEDKMINEAISLGKIESVKTIIKLGITICKEALTRAVELDKTEIIDLLIEYGVCLDDIIFINDLSIIKKLVFSGANIYTTCKNGENILMKACSWRNIEMIRYILDNTNICVNNIDKYGQTALMYAVYALDNDIIKLLVRKYSADIHICDKNGETALTIAKEFKI